MDELLPFPVLREFGEDGPDPEPILKLHRADDGWIRFFHRAHPEDESVEVIPKGSVKAGDLLSMFPEYIDYLAQDGYYTVNSFWRGGTSKTEDLRYLNACFADLDHSKTGITSAKAVGMILEAIDTEAIPMPSVLVRSGRGTWLFYILDDKDRSGQGQRAYGAELGLYLNINTELHRRLHLHYPDLNPDGNALDASRLTRVPGSLNTKAMRYVKYLFLGDQNGVVPAYTVRELAGLLGIDTSRRTLFPPRPKSENKVPKRKSGWVAMKEAMLREFEMVRACRGGFREGHRNGAVLVYASLLMGTHYSPEEMVDEVLRLGKECRDATGIDPLPLSERECHKAVEYVIKKNYKFSGAQIAKRLKVTTDEAKYLGLDRIRPDYVNTAGRKYQRKDPDRVEHRHHAIRIVIEENGGQVPSIRKMKAALEAHSIRASLGTLSKDYKALGIKSEAATPKQPSDPPEPLPFDGDDGAK